jgi:tRNA A-37 threonylcarbamoyl transferase component Bud32
VNASESSSLLSVATRISDGDAVDWAQARQQSTDVREGSVLGALQVLERIAAFHRVDDEESDTPTDVHRERCNTTSLGRWRDFTLLEKIGEGTFGVVYRARDNKLQSIVALKLLSLSTERAIRPSDALKEARLLARVRHPNVVAVYGADIVGDRVGIWMEFIDGQTLANVLRTSGPLGASEAALIGVDLCRALAAVHRARLLHGDVKPRNVMREAGGRTVLMDFGTGKDLPIHCEPRDQSADLAGTPLYIAPEVFEGSPRTKLTDIYSLGVLLYNLVTNAYPVDGRSQAEVEEAHRCGTRTRLLDARPDLPEKFVRAVERALSVNPRDRYQTTGAFESALRDFLGQANEVDPPQPRWWLASVAAAVALAAIGAATYARLPTRPQQTPAAVQRPADPAAAVRESPYQIDAALYALRGRQETRLAPGARVAPGDELFVKVRVSVPAHVYIVNEDDRGESYLLFPLPGQAVSNPLPAAAATRIPGVRGAEEVSWRITSAGGREHFLLFASPERLGAFEEMFASLPRPEFGKAVQSRRLPGQAIGKLRGVGGLGTTPAPQASARLATVFTMPLTDHEETAHGLWVRQLTLENPGR